MKTLYKLLLIPLVLFLISATTKDDSIKLENEYFIYSIATKGNKIIPTSYYNKNSDEELLGISDGTPYFEFIINGNKVTSEMPVWQYTGSKKRNMLNGGIEYTSSFKGKGVAKGITLMLDHQYFSGSALVRERMRIQADKSGNIKLNNKEGKNHFIYPRYVFSGVANGVDELRMASFNNEILKEFDSGRTYDNRSGRNLSGCHMFHTDSIHHNEKDILTKGPFGIFDINGNTIITSYEHASQDKSIIRKNVAAEKNIDSNQGVSGKTEYIPTDDDYWFIGTHFQQEDSKTIISQSILRGGYLDNEAIPSSGYYETVWSTINFIQPQSDPYAEIRHYIKNQITEHAISREIGFYYNTWGMQRNAASNGDGMRDVFTEKRILEEIDYAADFNIDMFVLDDGWQEAFGDWKANSARLPSGLSPLLDRIRSHNMTPGIWLSLMGVDSTTTRYAQHRDWVIRDADGIPLSAQWGHPAFDLVGPFYEQIKQDHKRLIDEGIMCFKWDAINTFNSDLPGLHHGDADYSKKERIDRYNYLLPFYVVRLMRELREYNPEVVIEIDLTEPERAIVGLMPLQEGKLFWMNNGASEYGDYSTYRAKSMRTIINQTGKILSPEVLTYACYPHNVSPWYSQRYNINTMIVAGNGIWGDLKLISKNDRAQAGKLISKSKRVLKHVNGVDLEISGSVGATPEIYQQLDKETAWGQIIGFSGSPIEYKHRTELNSDNLLGVLNHAFYLNDDKHLILDMQFSVPDDTREAFVLGNNGTGISIVSSTGWLDNINLDEKSLHIVPGSGGVVQLKIPGDKSDFGTENVYTRSGEIFTFLVEAKQDIKINWK